MALNNEISWLTLNSLIDNLAPTLEKSREIINIILNEFQIYQSKQSQTGDPGEKVELLKPNEQEQHQLISRNNLEISLDEDYLEQDIIEAVRNIETESENESEDLEDELVVLQNNKYVPEELLFVELMKENNQDDKMDYEDQANEDLDQNQGQEAFNQEQMESRSLENSRDLSEFNRHEMNYSDEESLQCMTNKTKKAEVIKLKTLPKKNHKIYQCKFCPKNFKQSSNLKVHERRIHTGEKPFKCKVCLKQFSDSTMLDRHNRIHSGSKPFQCETCNKCFNDIGNLNKHKRIHSVEKPYECENCGKYFRELDQLKAHERIQDSCLERLKSPYRKIHSKENDYRCEVCQKCFTNVQNLKRHIRIHSAEKPHKCKICGKCFREQDHLKIHERIHTNEKPYQCKNCDKGFRQSSNLKEHTKQCEA